MSDGHKRYSAENRKLVTNPEKEPAVGTTRVETSAFKVAMREALVREELHKQTYGGRVNSAPNVDEKTVAERQRLFEQRRADQLGTPLDEVFTPPEIQSCLDFLEHTGPNAFEATPIPEAHRKRGIISRSVIVDYSLFSGYYIGHLESEQLTRHAKNDRNISAEVFLCEDRTLRAYHPNTGLEPLALNARGESLIPSIGYYTAEHVSSNSYAEAYPFSETGGSDIWKFHTMTLADRLRDMALGWPVSVTQAHHF